MSGIFSNHNFIRSTVMITIGGAALGFLACSNGTTAATEDNEKIAYEVVESDADLSEIPCDTENGGKLLFVENSSIIHVCDGKNWISINNEDISKIDSVFIFDTLVKKDTIILNHIDSLVIRDTLVVYGPMSSYNPFLSSSSNPWGGYSSELPIIQYSSSWDSLASLSSSSELILSSFEFFESSSSIIDIVSSSSNFVFEYSSSEIYPIYSSSDIFPWSSSSDVNPPISSSSELLLSSETALSSEIALSSAMLSSSAEALPISGHCQAEKSTVPLGGSVRWTYVPDSGTRVTGMFVWQDLFSVEMEQEGEGLSSVTFTYPVGGPNVGEVVYPTTLKFDGVDIDCSSNAVRITAPENNLSSSSEFIPDYLIKFVKDNEVPQTKISVKNKGCIYVKGAWYNDGYTPSVKMVCGIRLAAGASPGLTLSLSYNGKSSLPASGQYNVDGVSIALGTLPKGEINIENVCVEFTGEALGGTAECGLQTGN